MELLPLEGSGFFPWVFRSAAGAWRCPRPPKLAPCLPAQCCCAPALPRHRCHQRARRHQPALGPQRLISESQIASTQLV